MMSEREHMDSIRTYFDAYADECPPEQSDSTMTFMTRCLDALKVKPGHRFLDIGSGLGQSVCHVGALDDSIQSIGMDVSARMVELARIRAAEQPNIRFIHAPFPLPFLKAKAFDAILSIDTFDFMPQLQWALVSVIRLLKPGGLFVCASSGRFDAPQALHVQALTMDQWTVACQDVGFEIIEALEEESMPDTIPRITLTLRRPMEA